MDRSPVSVLVFTLNEELNLPACLNSLEWCDDVVVIDSFSTDATLDICRNRHIRIVQNAFTGFGDQRNFALQNVKLKNDWVLILDADERVPRDLAEELSHLAAASPPNMGAYRIKRRFYFWGKWLRHSSLYPTWIVRFVRRGKVRYENRGHAETEQVDGRIGEIRSYLIDENRKGIDAWLERQNAYAGKDAEYELQCEREPADWLSMFSADPMRRRASLKRIAARLPFRGLLYFLYCYVFRMGFLDGRDGFVFCRMKAMYQNMIVLKKHELRKLSKQEGVRKINTTS
jgi:glycosyltransferase involved in cell wall biosynthesis